MTRLTCPAVRALLAGTLLAGLILTVDPAAAFGQTRQTVASAQGNQAAFDARPQPPSQSPAGGAVKALSLSPAVIMTRGTPGQSTTQTLTINNQTPMTFSFEMVAQDIIVRDGRRVFVPAGELPHSIAATAVFSRKSVTVLPGQAASVDVTVTLTPETPVRAIAAIFRGTDKLKGQGEVGMTASLGCLITFTASSNFAVTPAAIEVKPQTPTRPLTISLPLTNTGTEPVVPEGVVALLSDGGKLVGKIPFPAQRLLPGERLEFAAEYAAQLRPGHYRAVASFQFEDKTLSNTTDFMIE